MTTLDRILLLLLAAGPIAAASAEIPPWDAPPDQQTEGRFWRYHWYERGIEHGNPAYQRRLRVSSPEIVLHETFGRRSEARENGMMLIKAEENLFQVDHAELYFEVWGGHPGTANKRVTVNGRSTYHLPRVGTEEGHCTYFYPAVPLQITDLVNGYNAVQWAVDRGTSFWGHMLVDNAAVRFALADDHPDLDAARFLGLSAWVASAPLPQGYRLSLEHPPELSDCIERVDFEGWYLGYDENGDMAQRDWHGFTRDREPVAHLGSAASAPFSIDWDTSLLPAQPEVAVRAVLRFKDQPGLVYLTAATSSLHIPHRPEHAVILISTHDAPIPFWSRANRLKSCSIDLDLDPARITRAELHVVTWTGGAGGVKEYFTINGVPYPIAEGNAHETIYSRLPIDPTTLRRGSNRIDLLSDTDHHGIEIFRPGPALMVEYLSD